MSRLCLHARSQGGSLSGWCSFEPVLHTPSDSLKLMSRFGEVEDELRREKENFQSPEREFVCARARWSISVAQISPRRRTNQPKSQKTNTRRRPIFIRQLSDSQSERALTTTTLQLRRPPRSSTQSNSAISSNFIAIHLHNNHKRLDCNPLGLETRTRVQISFAGNPQGKKEVQEASFFTSTSYFNVHKFPFPKRLNLASHLIIRSAPV